MTASVRPTRPPALAATVALVAALACSSSQAARRADSTTAAGDVAPAAASAAAPAPTPTPTSTPVTPGAAPTATAGGRDSVTDRADRGRIMGDARATVWFVEASDFQCPYCKTWHDSTYPLIVRDYVKTGKIRVAYLNFPLNIHPNAMPAAEAAMCASVQGKFWEMHDALFGAQERWARLPNPSAAYDTLAGRLGVNVPQWRECLAKHQTRALVDADYERSNRAGVQSTPSFFVGDQLLAGAQPYAVFRRAIDAALAKSPAR